MCRVFVRSFVVVYFLWRVLDALLSGEYRRGDRRILRFFVDGDAVALLLLPFPFPSESADRLVAMGGDREDDAVAASNRSGSIMV